MEDQDDLILARQLQEQFDSETVVDLNAFDLAIIGHDNPFNHSSPASVKKDETRNRKEKKKPLSSTGLSVIDASWETTDPNPDVHALFIQYNAEYFWGKLAGVEVKWSPRMTLCAGVCSYEGHGGLCSIRLSVPLLKLRPRKDLVETLLHEMIHAYLFVTENDRDRDGHGPNFQSHMHRINKASGAHITIYHDFHDEVDNYRQHWWRCDGPCRSRPPYFGFVKRSMNRAPSKNDTWWTQHLQSCGGSYTKVKEPEGYGEKKKAGGKNEAKKEEKAKATGAGPDIRSFLGNGHPLGGTGRKTTNTGPKDVAPSASNRPSTSTISKPSGSGNQLRSDILSAGEGAKGGIWGAEEVHGADTEWKANKGAVSAPQRTWSVVETEADRHMKEKTASNKEETGGSGPSAGRVLGKNHSAELNWLAKLRQQWTQEDNSGSSSATLPRQTPTSVPRHASPVSKSAFSDAAYKSRSSDDDSHASFHVSDCDIDEWPSPDKPNKAGSDWLSKRKRSPNDKSRVREKDSSQTHSKRQKPLSPSKFYEPSNVFHRVKTKNASPVKGVTNTGAASGSRPSAIPEQPVISKERTTHKPSTSASSAHSSGAVNPGVVSCPSCQQNVPQASINEHLDRCLV